MGFFRRTRRPAHDVALTPPGHGFGTDAEDPVVRQYRFLLRTAPQDALEAAHAEALPQLSPPLRTAILHTTQEHLLAGLRLGLDDTDQLAHLLTLGERRVPGVVLAGYDAAVLRRLAQAVIDTEAVFGLFGGYAVWDGAEPEQPEVEGDMAGFDQGWHQALGQRVHHQGIAGSASSDSWGGFGGI